MRYLILALSLILISCGDKHEFNPAKLTVVVPYSLSGGSGKSAKAIQDQLSAALGESVYLESIPGENGLTGARAFWESSHNDRVMLATTAKSVPSWDIPLAELEIFPIWTDVVVIGVSPDSPIKNAAELIALGKTETLQILTAGVGSAGDIGLNTMARLIPDFQYEMQARESGTQAIIDVATGDGTDVVIQLFSEMRQLIEDGDLIPLAVVGNERFEYKDIAIPPLSDSLDTGVPSSSSTFTIMIPADSSPEFIESMRDAWKTINVDDAALLEGTVSVVSHPNPDSLIADEVNADNWADK